MKRARKERLEAEYEEILQLQTRVATDENGKPLIDIEPMDMVEGYPPERYIVTYHCKSVIKIKEDKQPIYGYEHKVEIHLGQDFLENGPSLSAATPIWHPNIDHKYPFHICYNAPDFITPMTSICDLIIRVGEIIQYKIYHALWIEPHPYDIEAADWVLDFAEPRGILAKDTPIDSTNLLAEMINVYPSKQSIEDIEMEEVDVLFDELMASGIDSESSGLLELGTFKSVENVDDNHPETGDDNYMELGTFKKIT